MPKKRYSSSSSNKCRKEKKKNKAEDCIDRAGHESKML